MRHESIQQFAIVRSDSAPAFEEELNARVMELSGYRPVVSFHDSDPLFARISYTISKSIPENARDEYELKGVIYKCEDCPMFSPIVKKDGTEDRRLTYGECEHCEMGRTYKDNPACDYLFTMIRNGRVGLCWKR